MPGTPKKRAKREAEAARAAGLAPSVPLSGSAADAPRVAPDLMSPEEFEADRRKAHVEYSEELADEVLAAIASGVGLIQLCKVEGMPSRRTIYQWRRDRKGFAEKLEDARRFRADARADLIDALLADVQAGRIDAISGRMILDGHRWLAGKENYKYSDTQRVEMTGAGGGPIAFEARTDVETMELARFAAFALRLGEETEQRLAAEGRPLLELAAEGGKDG